MPRLRPSCLLAWLLLLLALAVPVRAQTAFLSEFHTDDGAASVFDRDGDGRFDQFSDLEFVEFAIETSSGDLFDARDVYALFYDREGHYTGFAITPAFWEQGESAGFYTLFSFGPFSVPLDTAPIGGSPVGALADGTGAVALAYAAGGALHLVELISYGDPVTLTDDRWFGTVAATPMGVDEQPRPISDIRRERLYSLCLMGTIGPPAAAAAPAPSTASASLPLALEPGQRDGATARALAPEARVLPRGPAELLQMPGRLSASFRAKRSASPPGLTWTECAQTASPGVLNDQVALPVELTRFEATRDGADVLLSWTTASETHNAGFHVEHATEAQPFTPLGFVPGAGTTTEARTYAFRATRLTPGRHRFRLRQVDLDGASAYSTPLAMVIEAEGGSFVSSVYPNPFRSRTQVTVTVEAAQRVRVEVFDVLGRTVATLHDGPLAAHAIRRFTLDGTGLASGVYFVRVTGAMGFRETRRVVLVR